MRASTWRTAVIGLAMVGLVAAQPQPTPPSGPVDTAGIDLAAYDEVPGEEPLDERSAMSWAKFLDRPVEATELTTPTRKVTANPDGFFTAEVSAGPVRVRQGGSWVSIDPSLVTGPDGRLVPRASGSDLSLDPGAGRRLVTLGGAKDGLSLSWPSDLPTPGVDGNLATYPEVFPGVDLVVEAGVEGFATYLVVKTREAAANPALAEVDFGLDAPGAVHASEDGSIEVQDATGVTRFTASQPRMWDSSNRPELPATAADRVNEALGARARKVGTEATVKMVRLLPDQSFLTDPATTYPVVIDPDWSSKADEEFAWAMVWSNGMEFFNSSTQQARVGYDGWSSASKKSRSFYKFNTNFFLDKRINTASFKHAQIHSPSYQCDTQIGPGVQVWRADPFGPNVSWPGPTLQKVQSTRDQAHGHQDYCPGATQQEWTVTNAVQWAIDNQENRLTLGMISGNDSNRDGWRKYKSIASIYPRLVVEYNTRPDEPTGLAVQESNYYADTDKSYTPHTTLTLQATIGDADGDPLDVEWKVGGDNVEPKTYTNSRNPGTRTIGNIGPLAEGEYWFRVRTQDDNDWYSSWAPRHYFVVDTTKPQAPSSITPPKHDLGYGEGGNFTFTATDPDAYGFKYGFTTDTTPGEVAGKPDAEDPNTRTATHHYRPATFGPDWVTVRTYDRAGNVSNSQLQTDFRVKGTEASHHWELDANGNDAEGGVKLDLLGGVGSAAGRYQSYDPRGDASVGWAAADKALSLDGVNDEVASSGPVLETNKSFSVSAWVKLDQAAQGSIRTAVAQIGSTRSAFYLGYNKVGWAFWVRDGDDSGSFAMAKSAYTLPAQPEWVHLIGVYHAPRQTSARKIELYVNGRLAVTAPATDGVFNAGGPLTIGRAQFDGSANNYWNGQIDDVRVFPGPLDPLGALALSTEIRDQEVAP